MSEPPMNGNNRRVSAAKADPTGADDFLIDNESRRYPHGGHGGGDGKGSRRFICFLMALCFGAAICTFVGYFALELEDNSPNLKATVSKLTGETIVIANNNKNLEKEQKKNKNKNDEEGTKPNPANKNNNKNKNKNQPPAVVTATEEGSSLPEVEDEEVTTSAATVRTVETPPAKKKNQNNINNNIKKNPPPKKSPPPPPPPKQNNNNKIKKNPPPKTSPPPPPPTPPPKQEEEEEEVSTTTNGNEESSVQNEEKEVVVANDNGPKEEKEEPTTVEEEEVDTKKVVPEEEKKDEAPPPPPPPPKKNNINNKKKPNNNKKAQQDEEVVVETASDVVDAEEKTATGTTETTTVEEGKGKKDEGKETSEAAAAAEVDNKDIPTEVERTVDSNSNNKKNNQNNKNNKVTEEVAEGTEVEGTTESDSINNNKNNNQNNNQNPNPKPKPNPKNNKAAGPPAAAAAASTTKYNAKDVDLLDRAQLLDLAEQQKQVLLEKLYIHYGKDNFEKIFMDPKNPGRFRGISSVDGDQSEETLKRKFLIKVLEVQNEISKGGTAVEEQKKQRRELRLDPNNNNVDLDDMVDTSKIYTKLVWATGGHSAAAGHGNMYNESYTAYMSRDVLPFFANFGIDFEARNYAMGGTSSGYEVSSCYPQIFGQDVDIFSWDYGMTTQKKDAQVMHYIYRAAVTNSNPAFVVIRLKSQKAEPVIFDHLTKEKGLSVFQMGDDVHREMAKAIPDSSTKSEKQLTEMPFYVRNFKCGTSLEQGDPYCGDEKYTKYYCPDRDLRAYWHPGFKAHAMDGHVLSLFLMQTFMDALKDLSEHDEKDPKILLAQLKQDDKKLTNQFSNTPMIDTTNEKSGAFQNMGFIDNKDRSFDRDNKELLEAFFQGSSICRTGRTPSRSRYLGYATTKNKKGDIVALGNETYDVGIQESEAIETGAKTIEEMRLVWTTDQKDLDCTGQILKPDNKDAWIATFNDGLVKFPTFPNNKEKRAYGYNKSKFKGLLAIVLGNCSWGKCKENDVRIGEGKAGDGGDSPLENGNLEMKVNGKKVFSTLQVRDMIVLLGPKGNMYWTPSEAGDYEITVRVKEKDKYFKISTVVLV